MPARSAKSQPQPPASARWPQLAWLISLIAFAIIITLESGIGRSAMLVEMVTSGPLLIFWLTSAAGWGLIARRATQRSRLDLPTMDALVWITLIAAGLGIISLLTLGLSLAGVLSRVTSIGLLGVGAIVAFICFLRQRAEFSLRTSAVNWAWLALVPIVAFMTTAALIPAGMLWGEDEPNGYDVVEYHLQAPREWFEAGRMVPLTHNVFSFFPFNVEMHYLLAMVLHGDAWAAQFTCQLMHASYIALTVLAVYAAVRDRGRGPAMVAALLAASAPWLPMVGSIAYDEGGFLLYGTLAMAWMMRAMSPVEATTQSPTRSILIAGAMAGFACGCKLTGVPLVLIGVPCAAIAVIAINTILHREKIDSKISALGIAVVIGLLFFSPWLVRNAAWVGNPVFPEQQKLLGRGYFSPLQSDRFFRAHKAQPAQSAMPARLRELWLQTFADFRFGYALLPVGLIVMLMTLRSPRSQFLLFMLLGLTAFWLIETHLQGRFYILAIPIAAMATAELRIARPVLIGIAVLATIACYIQTDFAFEKIDTRLVNRTGHHLRETIGYATLDSVPRYMPEGADLPTGPIVLVGDATAYSYRVPMTQLRYRTVFDVDADAAGSAVAAWCAGLPADSAATLWVDPGEIARLHRTYGTPLLSESLPGPRDRSFTASLPAGAVR